jgi:hypothetical protein
MDAREPEPDGALPGVTREYWPEGSVATSAGIEGYGWGALTVHFLVRYVLGLRWWHANAFELVPALPAAFRRPGATYTIGPLAHDAGQMVVTYSVPADVPEAVDISLTLAGTWTRAAMVDEWRHQRLVEGEIAEDGQIRLRWRSQWLQQGIVRVE